MVVWLEKAYTHSITESSLFYSSHIEFVYQAGRQLQPVDNASVKKILSFSNDRFGIKVFVFRFVSVPVKWIRTSSRIVGLGDIVGRKWVFQLKSSANLVLRGCVHARRTLKGLVADLRIIKKSFTGQQYKKLHNQQYKKW